MIPYKNKVVNPFRQTVPILSFSQCTVVVPSSTQYPPVVRYILRVLVSWLNLHDLSRFWPFENPCRRNDQVGWEGSDMEHVQIILLTMITLSLYIVQYHDDCCFHHFYLRNKLASRVHGLAFEWCCPILMLPFRFLNPNRPFLLLLAMLSARRAWRALQPPLLWLLPHKDTESSRIINSWSTMDDDRLDADNRRPRRLLLLLLMVLILSKESGTYPMRWRVEGLFAEFRYCAEWYCWWKLSQLSAAATGREDFDFIFRGMLWAILSVGIANESCIVCVCVYKRCSDAMEKTMEFVIRTLLPLSWVTVSVFYECDTCSW